MKIQRQLASAAKQAYGRFINAAPCLMLALLVLGVTAFGQTALTGGLRGTVTDKSGAVLAGAEVSVHSNSLLVTQGAKADSSGHFTLLGLTPAPDYEITVSVRGFKPLARGGIRIISENTVTVDLNLEVSQVNESVNVTATETALTTSPEVSQVIEEKRLTELPSNGRNLNRFALLDPHVRNTSGLGGDGFAQNRLSVNGNIFRETHYKLDGNSNFDALFNNAPLQDVSLSAVQEFKVLTNQFSAEYGGTSAGFLVTTTKSGSNEAHGEGFFFGRPSGIQARPPLSTLRVPNQLLQYGGAVGGPVIKDKTFFFANYERLDQERGAFIQGPVPQFFIGDLHNQVALVKVDHRFTDTHSLAVRLNGNRLTTNNPNDRVGGLNQISYAQGNAQSAVGTQVNDSLTLGKFINELRLSYVNAVPSNSFPLTPSVGIVRPGISTEGVSSYSRARTEVISLVEQVTGQFGRHVVRMGGEFVRQKIRDFQYDILGSYRFGSDGKIASFTQKFGTFDYHSGQTRIAAFVQDDWRIASRLTMNLGLRYDYQTILPDKNNFGPRVGFAYDVTGDGQTIVRGGVGLYYDQPFYHGYIQRFLLNGVTIAAPTYTLAVGAPGFPTFPNSLTAPPTGAAAKRNLFLPNANLRSPYTTQVSLGVQRKLFGDWLATADVIHSQAVKQLQPYDINAPSPFPRTAPGQVRGGSTANSVAAADATRPFATYQGVPVRQVLVIDNAGQAFYNALDLGLSKRFAQRFQFDAHYVYSSNINSITDDHLGANPNEWNDVVRGERGPSDFHQRHRFVANGLVVLPYQMQFSGIATLASGLPINAITGVDNNGDTTTTDRPVGFGRNAFRGPRQTTFDISLMKRVPFKNERARLELRADVFNLFNGSNYYQFNNVYGNGATPLATFRQPLAGVSNVDPGRQFQFAARMVF